MPNLKKSLPGDRQKIRDDGAGHPVDVSPVQIVRSRQEIDLVLAMCKERAEDKGEEAWDRSRAEGILETVAWLRDRNAPMPLRRGD